MSNDVDKIGLTWYARMMLENQQIADERDTLRNQLAAANARIAILRSGIDDEPNPSVAAMVRHYLATYGFDGLYCDNGAEGCGCSLDDFLPCGGECIDLCQAAYKHSDGLMYLQAEMEGMDD